MHIAYALFKTNLSSQCQNLFADVFHYLDQFEGADVRVRCKRNIGRRSGLDEFIHDLAAQVARILDLAVKLAVRKGAGAPFTVLHVGFGIQFAECG